MRANVGACIVAGVRGDAICPCACSSESLTVCVRRAGRGGSAAGRGVLSMSGLSYGVVRVDAENSLTSLTLQDCGQVMPSCELLGDAPGATSILTLDTQHSINKCMRNGTAPCRP